MILLAYLGPETMLPVTSVLAGVAGFIMMFGRKAYDLASGLFRKKPVPVAPQTRARGHRPATSRPVAAGPRSDAAVVEMSEAKSE